MNFSLSLVISGLCLLDGVATSPRNVDADSLSKAQLVSEFPCPDPYVFSDGTDWYIYGTGTRPFFLQGKEFGEGKMTKVFLDLDYTDCPTKVAQVWGFIVHRHSDDSYHAYGTLHLGNFHTVIAYFVPQSGEKWEKGKPITRWKFKKIMIGDPARQDWKYYETKILEDSNKSLYLMYVASTGKDNCIFAQKLKSLGEVDHSIPRKLLLAPEGYRSEDRNDSKGMQLVEGGSIFKWQGKYILLYSVGDYLLSNYKLGMAFSDTLIPAGGHTYRAVKLPDPRQVWGKSNHKDEIGYLLQAEKPQWPNYSGGVAIGPGLGSIVEIDSKLWLFFHGYKPEDKMRSPEDRFVFRLPLHAAIGAGQPGLAWLRAEMPEEHKLLGVDKADRAKAAQTFETVLKPDSSWRGISDWSNFGKGKCTRSELHCLKSDGKISEWEFVFLEESIFKTPIPFREKWSGKLIDDNQEGVLLRLTRFDGKAAHDYRVSGNGELHGVATNGLFTYRFQRKP